MIYWMKPLPPAEIDTEVCRPFIRSDWFRKNYMWFVYGLISLILAAGFLFPGVRSLSMGICLVLGIPVFVTHELLHFLVVFRIGNVSLTRSGIFFWIHSDAHMSKGRFWLFMSLPLVMLTLVPAALAAAVSGPVRPYLVYIAWLNAMIAGSDIINSVLILFKPRNAVFYRGYYKA